MTSSTTIPLSLPDTSPDAIDSQQTGRERGQTDGTPEDNDSFFDVVESTGAS